MKFLQGNHYAKKLLSALTATLFVFSFSSEVYALNESQAAAQIPNVFDAGIISKQVRGKLTRPVSTATVTQKLEQPKAPQTADQKIKFKLTKIILQGNTVFADAEIAKIYQDKINKTISVYDLQMLVQDITKKYREAGYILSRAILPPQAIKNGVVHVQIIEGYIHDVIVNGNAGLAASLLLKYGDRIKRERPLKISTLEHYMLLANDMPGVKVSAILNPAKNTPGAADLTLDVVRSRVGFSTSYDNYGTRYIGPNQVTVTGDLYSMSAPGSMDMGRVVTTTQTKELHFFELVHTQPIGAEGLNLTLNANYTQTQPDFVLEELDIVGRSAAALADLAYPLIRSRSDNFFVHGALNYQNITSWLLAQQFYQDRIRSAIVGALFNNVDHWYGLNTVAMDLEHGFPIFGAHDHANQSRPDGHTIFTKVSGTLSRLQGLGSRFSLLGAVHGQYVRVALLATEQFSYGGTDYGRGYDPSEIVGDRGLAGKIELRMDTEPELRFLQSVQYYVFYDAGLIWNIDNVDLPGKQTAMSTGVGARVNFMPQLSGSVFIAKPLTLPVATMQLLGRNANAPRVFFQLVLSV